MAERVAISGEVVKPPRKHVMTMAYSADGGDWQLFRATSRDIVAVEQRFPELSAAKIFGDVRFENMYKVLWWTLRRRGEVAEDVKLSTFMETHDVTVNVPVSLLTEVDLAQLREQGLIADNVGDDQADATVGPDQAEQAGGDDDEPDPTRTAVSSGGTSD